MASRSSAGRWRCSCVAVFIPSASYASIDRHQGGRVLPGARGTVLRVPARRYGRRRDQGRIAGGRRAARVAAARGRLQPVLRVGESQQALRRARSQEAGRARRRADARLVGRCRAGEFSPGRHGALRTRPRYSCPHEAISRLLLRFRLRPDRPARRRRRLRHDGAGDERADERDRRAGRTPRQIRHTGRGFHRRPLCGLQRRVRPAQGAYPGHRRSSRRVHARRNAGHRASADERAVRNGTRPCARRIP